jgi:hypothetical protein
MTLGKILRYVFENNEIKYFEAIYVFPDFTESASFFYNFEDFFNVLFIVVR